MKLPLRVVVAVFDAPMKFRINLVPRSPTAKSEIWVRD